MIRIEVTVIIFSFREDPASGSSHAARIGVIDVGISVAFAHFPIAYKTV